MTQVEVSFQKEVLFTGELTSVPWSFWHGVVFSGSIGDRDKLVEKLQGTNARWEGYLDKDGNYILHLPPLFEVKKVETMF